MKGLIIVQVITSIFTKKNKLMVLSKHKEVCPGFKILSLDCQQSLDGIQGNFKSPIQLILWFGFPREQNQGD